MGCGNKRGLQKQKELLAGVKKNFSSKILDFVRESKNGAGDKVAKLNFGKVDDEIASYIKETLRLEIGGYSRKMTNSFIRHVLKKHGDKAELKRGQIPVREDDFLLYEDIVNNPDSINIGKKSDKGLERIVYTKKYDNRHYIVEELRKGKKELVPVSMWIKRVTVPDANDLKSPPSFTSKTSRHVEGIIPQTKYQDKIDEGFALFGKAMGAADEAISKKMGLKNRILTISDLSKKVHDITHEFRIGQAQIYDEANKVKEFLENGLGGEDLKLLHKALSGDMDTKELPQYLEGTYDKMRTLINKNADALVESGALAETNKIEHYLKRYYEKHLKNASFVQKFYFEKKFKARKNLTYDERIALGMVEDASFVIPKTLAEQKVQLLKAKTLKNVANEFGSDVEVEGYIKISDETNGEVYKYGALAGKWVQKDVFDAVMGAGMLKENIGIWEKYVYPIVDHIKVNVTVKNPFTHLYNVGSNLMLSYLHGDMKALGEVLHMAVHDKKQFDLLIQKANRHGLNSYLGEMESVVSLDNKKEPMIVTIMKNAYFAQGSSSGDFLRNAYAWEDKIFKVAAFHKHLKNGVDELTAFKASQEAYVDYDTPLPASVRVLDKSGLTPFMHYTYKSTPTVLKTVLKHPFKAGLMQVGLMGVGASAWLGDNEEENLFKPKWAESGSFSNAMGIKSWFEIADGWYLNVGRLIPGMRFDGFDTLEFGGGFVRGGLDILAGKTPLGYSIGNKYDSTATKTVKRILEMSKNYLPPLTFGRYGQQALGKATGLNEPENYYNESMGYTEMFVRGAGVRHFNKEKEVQSRVRALKNRYKHEIKEATSSQEKNEAKKRYDTNLRKIKNASRSARVKISEP